MDSQSQIPTVSHEQSKEWGLVLLSQGITGTISKGVEGMASGLIVATDDYPAAMRAIRLYRQENRHWNWQKPLVHHGFLFDWKICGWVALLSGVYFLTHELNPEWLTAGCVDSSAIHAGEWWRIFTAMLLHADLGHLASNLSTGVLLLGLAMGRFGGGHGLLLAYLAGAAGNIAGLFLHPEPHRGLGASGMVMGGLGLLAAQSFSLLKISVSIASLL